MTEIDDETAMRIVNRWATVPVAESWDLDGLPARDDPVRGIVASAFGAAAARDDAMLADAADAVYPIYAAPKARQAALINHLIEQVSLRPELVAGLGLSWASPDATVRAALALHLLRALGLRGCRIGVCAAPRCIDAFVDASHARRRRYCSLSCQSRVRQAAYRRRHQGTASNTAPKP